MTICGDSMGRFWCNEYDRFAAEWLANLYPNAVIDQRSVKDVATDDLAGFRRCHFFAGIGGWEYALALAGWPDEWPVWTGSCPCQPFSSAGKRLGQQDERHLWPDWFRVIRERRPECILGEQVPDAIGHGWLDGVFADLEGEGYTCGAVVLGAHSVGANHKRQRLWWFADSQGVRREGRGRRGRRATHSGESGERARLANHQRIAEYSQADRDADAPRDRRDRKGDKAISWHAVPIGVSDWDTDADRTGFPLDPIQQTRGKREAAERGSWFDAWERYAVVCCRDGRARRIGAEPGAEPLAHGLPRGMGRGEPGLGRVVRRARSNRVGRLRGYGNAIVPQVAAVFVRAVMEWRSGNKDAPA